MKGVVISADLFYKGRFEKEIEIFIDEFYSVCDKRLDRTEDLSTAAPWSSPWDWGRTMWLHGFSIEQMARNHYREIEIELMDELDKNEEMEINL